MRIPDNRARSRIVAIHLGLMLGRLRPVLLLSIADLLRNPFCVPGCPEPGVESGTLLPPGDFDAFEHDSYTVTVMESKPCNLFEK